MQADNNLVGHCPPADNNLVGHCPLSRQEDR